MKKIFLLVLLALISVTASARKSYITVKFPYSSGWLEGNYDIILTGDVPEDIAGFQYIEKGQYYYNDALNNPHYTLGGVLNVLSEYGYEVEFTIDETHFLLSKEIPSSQTTIKGDVNEDSEVNIADVNEVISLILDKLRENPKLLEELGIVQPK